MSNKEILLRLFRFLSPYRGKLIVSMIAMVFVALLTGAQTYMVKDLLDKIFIEKNAFYLYTLTIAVVVVFGVKGLFYYTYNVLLERVGLSVIMDFRNRVFRHIHLQPLSFFHDYPTGTLISRVIADVTLMQQAVSSSLVGILRDFLSIIVLLGVVFYLNWHLAIFCFAILPFAAYPIITFGRIFRRLSTTAQEETANVSNVLYETITGNRIVKAFNMEDQENKRFGEQLDTLFRVTVQDAKFRCLQHPLMEFIGGIALSLFIWFGGRLVINGSMTPGEFFALMTSLIVAYDPVKRIGKVNSAIQQGLAAATRIFAILDIKPEIADRSDAIALLPFQQAIEFRNVHFTYGDDTPALSEINLTVPAGQTVAIVGHSGGGKTTLTNLIPRFLDVSSGSIVIDGHDIRDVTMHSLRAQIAIVTQQTILFNETVRNNIAYGNPDASDEEVHNAAEAAHALSFINELPSGFATIIGEGGTRLSGGQRQRISIARALLKNAPILILDEATSALDTESEREVQGALENLMKDRTTFVIAHRLSTIRNAHRIIVIKNGRIVEDGTHDSLLAQHGEYEALYTMQFN
ncbi:lipid A export permease/ATP-binding protein MsbA [Desulfofustis glycolicus]|uniref:ATP-binding cassette, subfamily B, MsbA n=1 Tax=Desulfofustis glycolicus DSM 9705 TaxID=1121409 RepID=A0A1M5YVE5_9BACT|nr:lipid A export permease/ATP-binding protein MsbA [Desulfofustis glycolicus]MCB2214425.1 lipid A export permease/ATP-binding protein MsbA [Desulfobulbaceae bacterium]SHI15523.1 ATP-binding cassette, subfamily B, MsbA [Desulfofustis glycolicus DSM 9705]